MFQIVDKNNSKEIEFSEFMRYIFLLLEGTRRQKSEFIFKMIAFKNKKVFNSEDLTQFYILVNKDYGIFESENEEIDDTEEIAMARTVFGMMKKSMNDSINLAEFQDFMKSDKNHVNLFNFLRCDAESSRKDIRHKRSYLVLLNTTESFLRDLEYLENIIFPHRGSDVILKKSVYLNKFKNNFKDIPVESTTRSIFKKEFEKNVNLIKETSVKKSRDVEKDKIKEKKENSIFNVEEELKINTPHPTRSWKHKDLEGDLRKIAKLITSMKIKADHLHQMLKKEVESILKKETLKQHLKQNFDHKKKTNNNQKVVFLNNPNWNIVTTMISGIYKSINIISNDKYHSLSKYDFKFHNKIEMQSVYSNNFKKCKFKDYAPYVFENIRRQFGITSDMYLRSIGVNTFQNAFFDKLYLMLAENSSGKSGSFFFHSADGKYMLKTISQNEFNVLLRILPDYHKHLMENPNTLMARYYGLHRMKCYKKRKIVYDLYICVMNNVFDIEKPELIQNLYDLKGSTYKRITKKDDIKKGHAKKDLNFLNERMMIKINSDDRGKLLNQVIKDVEFFSSKKIIDYSLLLGIISNKDDTNVSNNLKEDEGNDSLIISLLKEKEDHKLEKNYKNSFFKSKDKSFNYYLGIIDTLTEYSIKKKSEFVFKRVFQGKGISCLPPEEYKKRFFKFLSQIIE